MVKKEAKLSLIEKWRLVKTWQLIAIFGLMFFVAITFLRLNDVGMSERRSAVYSADKAGDNTVLQSRLYDLQRYASNHMNANTGNIELVDKFNRDVEAIVKRALEENSGGQNIFKIADGICRPRFHGWSLAYVQCVDDELAKFPAQDNPIDKIIFPNKALYRHNFISPLWSLDFAGVSILITALIGLLIVIRTVEYLVLRIMLKKQYRSI